MARSHRSTNGQPQTTAQSLGSLLKSARDIMRKDKGLNGDLDRLPLLTWIMFLKFLDDLEGQREEEAALAGQRFRPALGPPYRWRDWAARADGITGDELLAFINQDECTRPDGTRGLGLFAYLRQLTNSNGDDRRDVIATVFRGVDNRMKSGYLLRDIINKVHGIHFTSGEELHTLGTLYESMLREMRDAAGVPASSTRRARWCVSWCRWSTRASARPCSTPPAAPAGSWSRRSTTSVSR
jgi:type I restriction enzyme M protein